MSGAALCVDAALPEVAIPIRSRISYFCLRESTAPHNRIGRACQLLIFGPYESRRREARSTYFSEICNELVSRIVVMAGRRHFGAAHVRSRSRTDAHDRISERRLP